MAGLMEPMVRGREPHVNSWWWSMEEGGDCEAGKKAVGGAGLRAS